MKKDEKEVSEIDIELIKKIQPQGGIKFDDDLYVKTGDGYEACLHVMEYPEEMEDFWLAPMTNIEGTVAMVDISTDDVEEVKKNLNRSMKEQNSRYRNATDYTDELDAETKFQKMDQMMREIQKLNEIIKIIDVRIYVADRTWIGLEEKIKNIKVKLDNSGYKVFINMNETKNDWLAMHNTYRFQQKERTAVEGQSYQSNALAGGYPFHFSQLEDPRGGYYGYTPTGGNFIWDMFYKTKMRSYYNSVVMGTMGSGKSTLLKKMMEDEIIKGHFVRVFDVTGEFIPLAKNLGGKILKPDGSGSDIQNPLQILRASDSEQLNFARHTTRLSTFYKSLEPSADQKEITNFINVMRDFYEERGLIPTINGKENRISDLSSESYPIFGDVLTFLDEQISKISAREYGDAELVMAQDNLKRLNNIRENIVYIINNFGTMFNGHSSIDNILDEQLVVIDISALKDMPSNVFAAQMTTLMALCWDNMITNGKVMKEKYESGRIGIEDVVDFLILIDESHRWINTANEKILEDIITYEREARKYFGGICMASQSIRDFVPEGSTDKAFNMLKTIFELTQYKFVFHQDNNAKDILKNIFGGVFTSTQLNRIPMLEMGDTIVNLSSAQTMEVHIHLTDEEAAIFSGGL